MPHRGGFRFGSVTRVATAATAMTLALTLLHACTTTAGSRPRLCVAKTQQELMDALQTPECLRLRVERFDLHFTPDVQQLLAEKPLVSLALSGTTIQDGDLGFLSAVLEGREDLESLLLWGNRGLDGPALVTLVAGVLRTSPKLRHLTVSGNKFDADGGDMTVLIDAMRSSTITKLVLTDNGITPASMAALAGALGDMSLTSLEISCESKRLLATALAWGRERR